MPHLAISTEEFVKLFEGKQDFNKRRIGREPKYSLKMQSFFKNIQRYEEANESNILPV